VLVCGVGGMVIVFGGRGRGVGGGVEGELLI